MTSTKGTLSRWMEDHPKPVDPRPKLSAMIGNHDMLLEHLAEAHGLRFKVSQKGEVGTTTHTLLRVHLGEHEKDALDHRHTKGGMTA